MIRWFLVGLLAFSLTGCGASDSTNDSSAKRANAPAILLFTGRGTSPNDVAALERILSNHHFSYSTANSLRLNGLSESELRAHRLLLVPGGDFEKIGNGLTSGATGRLRHAIASGLSY